ncbi:hypothetical protein [Candidatus Sororendozoicomonas aggregata]|uniref:hypothetical protein n=1 Tax=Candidatus Sororendozoicomonas aggregata TaxID=3073239 RepID=UPI002ED4E535
MPLHRSATLPRQRRTRSLLVRSESLHKLESASPCSYSLAQAALRFAKHHTPRGSANQGAGHVKQAKPWTPYFPPENRALVAQLRYRRKTEVSGANADDKYVELIKEAKVGNCTEQSFLVYYFLLHQHNPPECHMVSLSPGDHVFVVLNESPNEEYLFPDHFNDWREDAVIIDAWVGICVAARRYPDVWRMTLDTMAAMGIELCLDTGNDEGSRDIYQWLEANTPCCRQMLDVNKKYRFGKEPK